MKHGGVVLSVTSGVFSFSYVEPDATCGRRHDGTLVGSDVVSNSARRALADVFSLL